MSASFDRWMKALTSGDDRAVAELWDLFYVRLCRRVAGASKSLRWFDQEDIALDTMADLCESLKQGKFQQLSTTEDLWKLLATIAVRRTCDRHRYERAARRCGGVETLSFQDVVDLPKKTSELHESEVARLVSERLAEDGNVALVNVIRLRLEGLSNQEVADQLGCSVRKVQCMVEKISNRLSRGDLDKDATAANHKGSEDCGSRTTTVEFSLS